MPNLLRNFYDALNREETVLAKQIAADSLGVLLRTSINELDLDFEKSSESGTDNELDQERSYLMRIGVNRAIKLALNAHPYFEAPTLTFQRTPELTLPVLTLIRKLATIEHGRRVAQSIGAGVGSIERTDEGHYKVLLPPNIFDLELHERELDRWYISEGRRKFNEIFDAVTDPKDAEEVRALMHKLVYPYATHFIGYATDPIIDEFFFGIAYNEIQISPGYDNFHFAARFGGMTFQHYKLAATYVMYVAFKHRAFVDALLEKSPTTRLEDILTVSVETPSFVDGLRDFINYFGEGFDGHVPVSEEGAKVLFDVLSISRRNTELLDRPGAPIAPLIQCSADHVIRPVVGAKSDLMLFLLNSLRHSFPRDYDRAQGQQESAMQAAAKRVLRAAFSGLEYRDNVRLRRGKKLLTDIDLVVIDPRTGRILLVQLKHQDPYGSDIATKQGRTDRLNEKVAEWLIKVRDWLIGTDESELRATLRLSKSIPTPKTSLLVLTRFYAHSLRPVVDGDDVSFANWSQLVTAVEKLRVGKDEDCSIDDLLSELDRLSRADEVEFLPEPSSQWQVGDLQFSITQQPD